MANIGNILGVLQNDTAQANYKEGLKNLGSSTLSKDAFLRLYTAQLRNQDPTNPQDSQQILGQQAQLAQVEKLDQLNSTLLVTSQISQGAAFVGKDVQIRKDDGSTFRGRVDNVTFSNGGIGLQIGDQTYALGSVEKIFG
ncbi:MAG: hypothetical protein K2X01_09340 [Cyanobacteria bacterium]|nr:hypothetical protein [Cyanobacteriota bacterium]